MQHQEEPRTHDHNSDPARTPGDGWVDEGGASHLGPATHIYSAAEGDEETSAEADDPAEDDDSEASLGRS